ECARTVSANLVKTVDALDIATLNIGQMIADVALAGIFFGILTGGLWAVAALGGIAVLSGIRSAVGSIKTFLNRAGAHMYESAKVGLELITTGRSAYHTTETALTDEWESACVTCSLQCGIAFRKK